MRWIFDIKFGSIINEEFAGTIKVSIVATGILNNTNKPEANTTPFQDKGQNPFFQENKEYAPEMTNTIQDEMHTHGNDDELNTNFGGYDIPTQEDEGETIDDYFNSYSARTGHTINHSSITKNQQTQSSFVPKQSVDIHSQANQPSSVKTERTLFKNMFKINRGN